MRIKEIIVLSIFLISFISASVSINPSSLDISQLVGQSQDYSITINNTNNFSVSNFKFGNLTTLGFIFPQNTTTPANSTRTITFSVNPTNSLSESRTEKIEFKFTADIPTELTTYYINISATGFNPNYLTIRAGDTIVWTNKDTIFHNVFSNQFNQNINPTETFSYTFNNIGIYSFVDNNFDEFNSFHGTIEVINRSSQELVHNPNYDFNWNVNVNFFLNPTNVTFEILDDSFEVSATGTTEGLIRIKNIGSERAERINLSATSNWIIFDENNFNLNPNEQNIVTFRVAPIIFNTQDTNKTYLMNLTMSGSNIETQNGQVSVFIPYTQVFSDTDSNEGFFVWFAEVYCPAHPNLFICNPNQTIIVPGNSTNQNFTLNVSSSDFLEFLRRLTGIETAVSRQENKVSSLESSYGTSYPYLENLSNSSYHLQIENERKSRRDKNVFWISFMFILISGCISYGFYKWRRVRRKQLLKEGSYEFSRPEY